MRIATYIHTVRNIGAQRELRKEEPGLFAENEGVFSYLTFQK